MTTVSASAGNAQSNFTAQARAAGLTNSQIRTLEREVNAFISRSGGRQVAINKVAFNGGDILFAVPGWSARQMTRVSAGNMIEATVTSTCPVGDFCEWNGTDYAGTAKATFYAYRNDTAPFTGNAGSWKNDQTPQNGSGPKVIIYYVDFTYVSPPPWSSNPTWDWFDALSVTLC